MPLDRRDIGSALEVKGFTLDEGRDHRFYKFFVDGHYTGIMTKISRGSGYKQYGDSLLALMAKQMKISNAELREFVECTLSGDDYLAILRQRGHVPPL